MSMEERRERGGRSVAADGRRRRRRGRRSASPSAWRSTGSRPAASTQADTIDTLWDVLIIASVPMFVLVAVVVIFSVIDFRMRPGEENLDGPADPRQHPPGDHLDGAPGGPDRRPVRVRLRGPARHRGGAGQRSASTRSHVTGQQFAWTFEYNEGGRKFTNAQLYLPTGESVKFNVRSKDVIHDFWVPDFRMKIDAVPGITTHYRVTPTKLGEHDDRVRRALRPRARLHAPDRARHVPAGLRRLGPPCFACRPRRRAAGAQAGRAGRRRRPPTRWPSRSSRTASPGRTPRPAAAATRSPRPARTARWARISTRCSRARTRPSSSSRSSTRTPRSRPGFSKDIMPPNYKDTLSAAQIKALVDYLGKVTK